MTKAGEKLLNAAREAVEVAKCDHPYVEGVVVVQGKRTLRCMLCGATVHWIDKEHAAN